MHWKMAACLFLSVACAVASPVPSACPADAAFREAVSAASRADAAQDDRDNLVPKLAACLSHADPGIRDGLAYETLAAWLRGNAMSAPVRAGLRDQLLADLRPDHSDDAGFQAPFAALVLSEVARTDRISPWMTPGQRAGLAAAAGAYLSGVRDYRGYIDGEGWRHGVAHGADLAMQLLLNPALEPPARETLLAALASQVSPPDAPPYVHGEPERLARPVLLAIQGGHVDASAWPDYIGRLAAPAPMTDWGQAWRSEAGLARRHNLRAFLFVLHAGLSELDDGADWQAPVVAALRASQ